MDEMGKELLEMMGTFELQFYPDVAGAFRSMLTLQGSLQAISPTFNLSEMIAHYLKEQFKVKNVMDTALDSLEDDILNLIPTVHVLPKKIDHIIDQVEGGKFTMRMSFFTGLTGFGLGLLALGALFLAQTEDPGSYYFFNVFGYSGLGLSVIMLIRVAIQSLKRKQS